jgi:hypothetical protein
MNEVQERASRQYDAARREMSKSLTGKAGNRAEVEYGEAYQRMVSVGLLPQIRKAYRTNKLYRS